MTRNLEIYISPEWTGSEREQVGNHLNAKRTELTSKKKDLIKVPDGHDAGALFYIQQELNTVNLYITLLFKSNANRLELLRKEIAEYVPITETEPDPS